MKAVLIVALVLVFSYCSYSQESECINSIYKTIDDVKYRDNFGAIKFLRKSEWQNGFVVMNNGDTLFGKVLLNINGIHIDFKNAVGVQRFRADKYKCFRCGEHFFISKKFDGYHVNAELIEKGKVCFYAYEQISRQEYLSLFYVEKGSDIYGPFTLDWFESATSRSWIYDCFGDYPSLITIMEKEPIKFPDLFKACKTYNCWYKNANAN